MLQDRAQRTEKPTPKRLLRARKEGNVPRTKELPGAMGLAGFLIFCHVAGGPWLDRFRALLASIFTTAARPEMSPDELTAFLGGTTAVFSSLILLPLGVMFASGLAGNIVQGAPPFTLKPLKPDFSKLNPISGLRKVFRLKALVELSKTLAKMVLFTLIAIVAVRGALVDGLPVTPGVEGTFVALMVLCGKVMFRVILLSFALALLDWLYNRFDHTQQLLMTKQELRDERKEQEGDPLVRARIRSKQMTMARSRMMTDVRKATVVVTNPTHFAVALRFVPGETDVPRVMAKGRGKLARRIREIALEHRIPVISDPPLARALYRAVEVGGFIPEQLYRAVAEVLALLLRRGARRRTAPAEELR